MIEFVYLVPLLPLVGFVTLMLMGRRLGEPAAGWVATTAVFGSFVSAVIVWIGLLRTDAEERQIVRTIFEWVPAGDFSVDLGFLVDPLSVAMMLFITGVGTLIHLYSIGYMHGDPNFSKFFVYLNMFVFAMLILVLGDNLLLTFLGWEGVGACSYLLVSFWHEKETNAMAGKKAFVTNRVGDWGYMVGMFLAFATVGSLDYLTLNSVAPQLSTPVVTIIVLMLFIGVMGKSAQFPLFLWLPDAMAGPTPVSALIHAATMVTSGIYLLTRVNGLVYEVSIRAEWATILIAWVGVGTALFAATIAVAQTDIKRVLAYSTVSQLGYMVLAIGTGSFVAAIFHMITHAFFKALLFLGSGSVIHGMADDQDMRRYGGLRKFMPITAGTFIIGWLAIAGVPPFSGFWSKDEILLVAFDFGGVNGPLLWLTGLITAMLTGFYMSRQVYMTFYGDYRFDEPDQFEANQAWAGYIADSEGKLGGAQVGVDQAKLEHLASIRSRAAAERALASATDASLSSDVEDAAGAKQAVEEATATLAKARSKHDATASVLEEAEAVQSSAKADLETIKAKNAERKPAKYGEKIDLGEAAPFVPEAVAARGEHHPHESPWQMTVPLVILAFLAVVAGVINLPFSSDFLILESWLEPALVEEHVIGASTLTKYILAIVAVLVGGMGMFAAYKLYYRKEGDPSKFELPILAKGWNYDLAVSSFMGGPGRAMFNAIAWFDSNIIDGLVRGTGGFLKGTGGVVRFAQSGYVRSYALLISLGSVGLLLWFVLRAFL